MVGSSLHGWATSGSGIESMKIGDPSEFITTAGKGLKNLSGEFKSISDKANKDKSKYEAGEAKKAKAAAKVTAKRSAAAKKGAATRAANAAPKPGRMSGSKGIDTRPSGLPTIKPVILNRNQHFESAVGNSKDTPSKPKATVAPIAQALSDPSTAYND